MRGYPKHGYLARVQQPQLSQYMEKRGLTLRSMARLTGLSRSYLSDFAAGKKRITGETVALIARKCRFPEYGNTWWAVVTKEQWAERPRPVKEMDDMAAGKAIKLMINQDALMRALIGKGWRLADLAKAAGVTTQTLYNVRSGRHYAKIPTAKAIADALGVDVLDLFEIREEE